MLGTEVVGESVVDGDEEIGVVCVSALFAFEAGSELGGEYVLFVVDLVGVEDEGRSPFSGEVGALPEVWLFALGGLFVGATMFLPRGLVGLLRRAEARP